MKYQFAGFSFGAGVQSTALLVLLKHEPQRLQNAMGHLAQKAYFADTGAELSATYQHLEALENAELYYPGWLETVNNGSILDGSRTGFNTRATPPLFTPGDDSRTGMLRRQCTSEFKVTPVRRALRLDSGLKPRQKAKPRSVGLWLGISVDEAQRMADNRSKWIQNLYPLIELGFDRSNCVEYCRRFGWEPPKSKCYFCPFTSNWSQMARNHPEDFAKAVEFDEKVRNLSSAGVERPCYVHRSLKPLALAVENQGDLFEGYGDDWQWGMNNECLGYCGT
ncbi:MAG: hypothetical protein AAF773_07685 [Cyanobacteria bacterium P01_D01_bin.115]